MKLKFRTLFSIMLTIVAAILGADLSMAAATPVPGEDTPQSQKADKDTKGYESDLTGTPATEAGIKDSDINDDEVEEIINRFCPFNYSLTTDIETLAPQKQVKDYEIQHAVMATPVMDCTLNKQSAQTSSGAVQFNIGNNEHISGNAQRMFGRSQTVHVKGVNGYTQDKKNTVKGNLELKVVARTSTTITLIPINGLWVESTGNYEVPAIPAGTELQMMATAGHTAQLKVSPKNQKPVLVSAFLQKKIMNTTIEKEWKEKKKKLPFYTEDIKDNALMTFRQENERTKLMGVANVLQENDETLGIVNCYYEEGVLSQLLMKYCTSSTLGYKDLVAMQKMQFGKWSMSNVAEVYCSYGFIEQLLNLDFTKIAQTNILAEQTTFGINITKFKTSFGTFNFKLCPILDEMGYENCAMVIDMKNAVRYWKKPNVSEKSTEDMSKGGEEPIEADRDRYIKIDCFCLRGYNSMLVGPAEKIYNMDTVYENIKVYDFANEIGSKTYTLDPEGEGTYYIGSDAPNAPEALVDGLLIYLKDAALGFNAGEIIRYDNSDQTWVKYSGTLAA